MCVYSNNFSASASIKSSAFMNGREIPQVETSHLVTWKRENVDLHAMCPLLFSGLNQNWNFSKTPQRKISGNTVQSCSSCDMHTDGCTLTGAS